MGPGRDIAVVSSPLQALGLFEWLGHQASGGRRPTIVLPWQGRASHANVVATLGAVGLAPDLDHAEAFPDALRRGPGEAASRWAFLLWLGRRVPQAERLLVGNYFNRDCRFLASRAGPGALVLLDDGIATRKVARIRATPRHADARGSWPRRLRRRLWAPPDEAWPDPPGLTYFTFYDDLAVAPPDVCVVHAFEGLRARVRDVPAVEETWFVGSPLVEEFGYPRDGYVRYLRAVAGRFGRLVYVAHRREDPANLELYAREVDVEPRTFGLSLEVVALSGPPRRLVTAVSSVLDTLPRIVGDRIAYVAARLPLDVGLTDASRLALEQAYLSLMAQRPGALSIVDPFADAAEGPG